MSAIAPAKCWQYPRFVWTTKSCSGLPAGFGGCVVYVKPPVFRSHDSSASAAPYGLRVPPTTRRAVSKRPLSMFEMPRNSFMIASRRGEPNPAGALTPGYTSRYGVTAGGYVPVAVASCAGVGVGEYPNAVYLSPRSSSRGRVALPPCQNLAPLKSRL